MAVLHEYHNCKPNSRKNEHFVTNLCRTDRKFEYSTRLIGFRHLANITTAIFNHESVIMRTAKALWLKNRCLKSFWDLFHEIADKMHNHTSSAGKALCADLDKGFFQPQVEHHMQDTSRLDR